MTVESAAFISGLTPAYPPGSDSISEGDDHLRLIKSVLQGTFPNANAAINGIHTKATAPTSTSAGQLWFDTTANVLKIRNEGDAGWVTLNISPVTDFKLLGSTTIGWVLPTADGISGQYLTTDAAGNLDWTSASGDELPSQTGHSGKFLTTNGSTASWATTSGLPAACMFRATMSAYQEVPNAAQTIVEYDTCPAAFNVGSDFDTTTYKFTAPNDGFYYIKASFRIADTGGSAPHSVDDDLYIYKDAVLYASNTALSKDGDLGSYTQAYPTMTQSCIMDMDVGETAYVKANTEGGDMRLTNGVQSYFEGYQVA